jgi:hypothetical protein
MLLPWLHQLIREGLMPIIEDLIIDNVQQILIIIFGVLLCLLPSEKTITAVLSRVEKVGEIRH